MFILMVEYTNEAMNCWKDLFFKKNYFFERKMERDFLSASLFPNVHKVGAEPG